MLRNPVFNIYLMACGVVNIEIIGMQAIPLAPDQTALPDTGLWLEG